VEQVENDYAAKFGNVAFEIGLYADRINALRDVLRPFGPVANVFAAPDFEERLNAAVAKINEQDAVRLWSNAYISADAAAAGALGIWRDSRTGEWFQNILTPGPVPAIATRNIDQTVKLAIVDVDKLAAGQRQAHFNELYKRLGDGSIGLSAEEIAILAGALRDKMTLDDRMKFVFDESGEYGGNQSSPVDRFDSDPDFNAYIKKLFPGMTYDETIDYLERYKAVGCGYMATANCILAEYANRPGDFQNTFGFHYLSIRALCMTKTESKRKQGPMQLR
jgi:hypothetical protein